MVFLLKAVSRLPLGFLYFISDLLAWVAGTLFKYRREVVLQNLENSFPEKTSSEITQIASDFYHSLADLIVETVKAISIPRSNLGKRVTFQNPELPESYIKRNQRFIVLTLHLGNWEWMSLASGIHFNFLFHPLYLPLTNKAMDQLILQTRSRFGAEPLSSFKELIKAMKYDERFSAGAILADQTPPASATKFWSQFLHQDTAFLPGLEKLPKFLNCPVLFMWSKRTSRGHYEVRFEKIGEPPYEESSDSIMSNYIRIAERVIHVSPEQWLWSHRRWKYSREES